MTLIVKQDDQTKKRDWCYTMSQDEMEFLMKAILQAYIPELPAALIVATFIAGDQQSPAFLAMEQKCPFLGLTLRQMKVLKPEQFLQHQNSSV